MRVALPLGLRDPPLILRAITKGRTLRSAKLLSEGTPGDATKTKSSGQDGKSRGWDWESSHVRALDRVDRLLLVLFLLFWWLAHLAAGCIHHGKRDRYDRADRRDKGIFRLGRLYLFDIERRNPCGGNIQQCLLFRKDTDGWHFSLRF